MAKYIVIVKKDGSATKFDSKQLPAQIRGGIGVRVTKLQQGNEVVAAFVVEENDDLLK